EGGHGGEEVAELEGPEHQQDGSVVHGHDVSPDGQISSSRTSHPLGCWRANTTAAATCSGRLSWASGPGLYCSGRPSKNGVAMPPGTRRVTPTRPAVSAANASVKPTTPDLLAQ